jgi:hypothetical protein
MLLNPEDVGSTQDAADGTPGLSTWMRMGHLVPGLGPIGVCVLAPGSATWTPLLAPVTSFDAGPVPEAEAAIDAPFSDAVGDVKSDGAPKDAHSDSAALDGMLSEGGPKADGPFPLDAAADADASVTGSSALAPLTMSRYLHLEGAGTFQLAIVPAGGGSCTRAYLTRAVTLDSDKHTTVVFAQTRAGVLASPQTYLGGDAAVRPRPHTRRERASSTRWRLSIRTLPAVLCRRPSSTAWPTWWPSLR